MKEKIRFGNSTIAYSVTKSKRRKTSQIIVDRDGVEVKTPMTKRDSEIKKLVASKKEWIFKKQLEFSDRKKLGKIRTKRRTPEYLDKRTWSLASKMGVDPSKLVIKSLKGRWGSATGKKVITLNSSLLKAPKNVIDYVIIHELCHLKVKDHSPRFWSLVGRHMPKYDKAVKWLEVNGIRIN